MFCQQGFDQWLATIRIHLPHVSKPQATVLALWSLGMVLARSCALSAVSAVLAKGLKRKDQSVRQQLREWCGRAVAPRARSSQTARYGSLSCSLSPHVPYYNGSYTDGGSTYGS
jgi:hypothetical protein